LTLVKDMPVVNARDRTDAGSRKVTRGFVRVHSQMSQIDTTWISRSRSSCPVRDWIVGEHKVSERRRERR